MGEKLGHAGARVSAFPEEETGGFDEAIAGGGIFGGGHLFSLDSKNTA